MLLKKIVDSIAGAQAKQQKHWQIKMKFYKPIFTWLRQNIFSLLSEQ